MMKSDGVFSWSNPWFRWGVVWLCVLTVIAFLIGFVVLPSVQRDFTAEGWWAAICRAAGLPSDWGEDAQSVTAGPTSTRVLMVPELAARGSTEAIGRGATIALQQCSMCHGAQGVSEADAPNLSAFDLTQGKSLAWVVDTRDASLLKRVTAFYSSLRAEGRLAAILDTYYGDSDRFDYIQSRVFLEHIETRLPRYRHWFREAAAEVGVDWRLLAAVGYQESHWDPLATSHTGVRGLMMLTEQTARALKVTDRLDPRGSIFGGARYFKWLRNQIPNRVLEPDRTWFTLAAYNVGVGHLEDARILTQMHGKNPDAWSDVRDHLPLLTQAKWYTRVKRGYARGWEPVRFVENIRGYIDILDWVATDTRPVPATLPPEITADAREQ
jgi:soluble lytic murein transglycosylase-like protein